MKRAHLFVLILMLGCESAASAQSDSRPQDSDSVQPLTQNDLKFYFDSIVLKNGEPIIALSEHTSGAKWSYFTQALSSGICKGSQVFQMAQSNRLDIIGKNFSIYIFKSGQDVLIVWLITVPNPNFPQKTEARRSFLKANGDGRFEIAEVPMEV